jgi:hypothetical protein
MKKSDGQFQEEPVACDGAEQTIIDALQCEVPLATLRADAFSLPYNELIAARV